MKRTSIIFLLASFVALAFEVWSTPTFAQTITRGPYLQRGHKGFMIVRWRTDTECASTLKIGTTPGADTLSFQGFSSTNHRVEISGLEPATRYYYKVMCGSSMLVGGDTSHTFVTSPDEGDEPFNVWALGDTGISATLASGDHPQQTTVRDGFLKMVPLQNLSFLIHLGDIAYNEGTDTQFQRGFFDIYSSILQTLSTWPTQGNHDFTENAYYDVLSLPRSAEAGGTPSGTEEYYSWEYGNAHFVSLNSENILSRTAMETWLRNDLASTTKTWRVAIFHHPPYTKGSHDSDNAGDSGGRMRYMRETILPILEGNGVDLVLSGHSHSYERSFFLNGHYGESSTFSDSFKVSGSSGQEEQAYTKNALTPSSNSGTVYVVAGSGGMLEGTAPLNHPAMFTSRAALGSMLLAFNANEITVKFITSNATVDDYFSIRKAPSLPRKPSSFDVDIGAECDLRRTWPPFFGSDIISGLSLREARETRGSYRKRAHRHLVHRSEANTGNHLLLLLGSGSQRPRIGTMGRHRQWKYPVKG